MKIGRTAGVKDRLRVYQTGSPFRDYTIFHTEPFRDAGEAEDILHRRLAGLRVGTTEWFQLHPIDARRFLKQLAKET